MDSRSSSIRMRPCVTAWMKTFPVCPVGGAVRKFILGGSTSLTAGFDRLKAPTISILFFYLVLDVQAVRAQLAAPVATPAACCHVVPAIVTSNPLGQGAQTNSFFHKLPWSWSFIMASERLLIHLALWRREKEEKWRRKGGKEGTKEGRKEGKRS